MSNTFGKNVTVTLFGESHAEVMGAVLDGIEAGVTIDTDLIEKRLSQRRGLVDISTKRRESDKFKIVSGIFNSTTTGAPICVLIRNENTDSSTYEKTKNTPRPSHADYSLYEKYHGFNDYRGGGHSSGRLTAPLVAVGTICEQILKSKGIEILTHIKKCGDIEDMDFSDIDKDRETLEQADIPVLDSGVSEKMKETVLKERESGDSVGGEVEVLVSGVSSGVGEPWFDTLEGVIAHAMFSIPAVKGIEFGKGFAFASMKGSVANDQMQYVDKKVRTLTNNNGGVLGGVTNGENIVFRLAIKPTPSIAIKQKTVDLYKKENTEITIQGRHDPFIAHKAAVAIKSMTALVLLDLGCGQ